MNFVETLAQSLHAGDSHDAAVTPGASGAESAPTDTPSDTGGKTERAGQDDLALALVSQSLAAALGLPAVTPPLAAPVQAGTSAPAANSWDATQAIDGDAAQSASGGSSPAQALASLLAANATAQSKDAAAMAQGGAPVGSTPDGGGANLGGSPTVAAVDPGASAQPAAVAHLGVASHFSVQHPATDSNSIGGQLRSTVATAAWQDELGGQITWMAHQGIESASLRLSPDHLGPLEVHISVRDNDASVWFGATQPDTRAALEQALPRLREMFASQGLTLTDSRVSHESPRNQSRPSPTPAVTAVKPVSATEVSVSPTARLSLGLVDTYA
ncbi:MAG TPA: flagellar hook-length control protein FliK [Steroidobacteraceae bacterium]|nr:flagellar hook-length control protein FliK [Steroidobacteraceae bacterium]